MMIQWNLILICSYVIFTIVRSAFAHFKVRAPNRMLLRHAQALVLVSILIPASLAWVPEKTLPQIQLHVFRSYGDEVNSAKPAERLRPTELSSSTRFGAALESTQNTLIETLRHSGGILFWVLWSLGVIVFSTRLFFSFSKLKKILNQAIYFKVIGSVRVVISETISVPFSVRFFKKQWVVLPMQLLENKSDFRLALSHELQHHRQGDTRWAVFIEVLQCLFYFNPAIYAWKNTIVELQEFSCDETLIGQRGVSAREYGSCLVRVAETALENREVHVGTTCMAAVSKNPKAFKSLLKRRIEMIMQGKKSAQTLAGSFIGTIAIVFTVAAAYGVEQSSRIQTPLTAAVDPEIQKIADQVLTEAIKKEGARAGFAIIADPQTGRILAVANIDHQNQKSGQWALSESMEPASLMKSIVAAEAIEEGLTTPLAEHNCENGNYRYGDRAFHDWKPEGWQKLSTTATIANSSDICALKIAEQLGDEKLHRMFLNYGFGSLGAGQSTVPMAAYGTGFRVTPLEIVQAYGAIANGGNLLSPKLSINHDDHAQIVRRVLSASNAKTMREILRAVVLEGTAKNSPSLLYTTAGKTESSYSGGVMDSDSTGGPFHADIAGFVGFAPVENPKVEIYVTIFNPTNKPGASGAAHAAPVFTELADSVLKYLKVSPDQKKI